MNILKSERREGKRRKRVYGHREDGRSVKLIQAIQIKKAQELKNEPV